MKFVLFSQTAERVLQEKCGSEIKARFLGNAPVGFYKYKFASPGEDNTVGAKVRVIFFVCFIV